MFTQVMIGRQESAKATFVNLDHGSASADSTESNIH